MMNTSLTSSSNGTPMRVCSDMRCKVPLSVGCKGNLCSNCVARMRSPRVFSSGRVQTAQKNVAALPYLPTSVTTHMGANMPMQYPNSVMIPHQPMATSPAHTGNVGDVPPGYLPAPRMQRSFTIPHHRPNVMYVPTTSVTQGVPTIQHFNSRGELIRHRRISPTVIDLRNPQPAMQERPRPQSLLPQAGQGCGQCGAFFVSRGPQDLCPRCQHRGTSPPTKKVDTPKISQDVEMNMVETKTPVQAGAIPKNPTNSNCNPQGKEAEDILMDDLELAYPETEGGNSFEGVSYVDADVQMRDILKLEDAPGDRKSNSPEKITSSPHGLSNRSHKSPDTHAQSNEDKSYRIVPDTRKAPSRGKNQFLKLCSSENCTGIISANSLATRCLQCVKNDWKLLADIRKVEPDHPKSGQAFISQIPSQGWSNSESIKRKGVTWADQVDDDTERQSFCTKSSPMTKIPKLKIKLQPSSLLVSSPTLADHAIASPSKQPLQTVSVGLSAQPPPEDKLLSPKESPVKSPEKLPRVRLLLSEPQEQPPSSKSGIVSTSQSPPAISPLRLQASQTTLDSYSGWESDLTELSETTDDASTSDAESSSDFSESSESSFSDASVGIHQVQKPQSSLSSGLKIRIPARPGGVFVSKCAGSKCNNTLALGYRWKSCVLCRAQNRQYQRRRHNVQAGHMRLDQELEVVGITFSLVDASHRNSSSECMPLVYGARLCSVRDCSFIVPPDDEYQWKMCALCRLRRRDQKKPQAELSKNKKSKHADILLKLTSPPFMCGRPRKGRCHSLDCGTVLTDSRAAQCPQCTTRRLRLMKRSGHYPTLPNPTRYSNQPISPSPYPQFKSFSAFLVEFKNRLAGFLQAQSVFFLFKHSKRINSVFALDGEYSVCCTDFDLFRRRAQIEEESLKLKRAIENVGRLKFNPTPQVSELDGGGITMRFDCIYEVPILQTRKHSGNQAPAQPEPPSLGTVTKHMKCELEIANLPDHSHRFIPGQRTIIRFRLLG